MLTWVNHISQSTIIHFDEWHVHVSSKRFSRGFNKLATILPNYNSVKLLNRLIYCVNYGMHYKEVIYVIFFLFLPQFTKITMCLMTTIMAYIVLHKMPTYTVNLWFPNFFYTLTILSICRVFVDHLSCIQHLKFKKLNHIWVKTRKKKGLRHRLILSSSGISGFCSGIQMKTKRKKEKSLRRKSVGLLTSAGITFFLELSATFSSKCARNFLLVQGLLNL